MNKRLQREEETYWEPLPALNPVMVGATASQPGHCTSAGHLPTSDSGVTLAYVVGPAPITPWWSATDAQQGGRGLAKLPCTCAGQMEMGIVAVAVAWQWWWAQAGGGAGAAIVAGSVAACGGDMTAGAPKGATQA